MVFNHLKFVAVSLKNMFLVKLSDRGSNLRGKEEQSWVHFCDFLDECEGKFFPFIAALSVLCTV